MASKRILFSALVVSVASVGAFTPFYNSFLHTTSRLSLTASATPLSDVYSIPDQPKRFANAKSDNNKRYMTYLITNHYIIIHNFLCSCSLILNLWLSHLLTATLLTLVCPKRMNLMMNKDILISIQCMMVRISKVKLS